jgi:hypothetical protein
MFTVGSKVLREHKESKASHGIVTRCSASVSVWPYLSNSISSHSFRWLVNQRKPGYQGPDLPGSVKACLILIESLQFPRSRRAMLA